VVAYELLFRDAPDAVQASERGTYATSQVIIAAFTEFGIRELVGEKTCFVNLTREFIVGDLELPFDPAHGGLEILADVAVDDAVLAGVAALTERGFAITLDEFRLGQGREALLPHASYAKVDMLAVDAGEVQQIVEFCRQYPKITMIAQRLETRELVKIAIDLGFELFQGNILGRPHLVTTHVLSASRLERLRLLIELSADEVNLERAVSTIERDPAMALRILQGVNSASNGLRREVSSVFEAVVLLGMVQVRRWATLMLAVDVSEGNDEHLTEAVIRARMCQTLAERLGGPGHTAFTVGLLSAVGEFLNLPAAELTEHLPLTAEVAAAVIRGEGPLGDVLTAVRAYEQGNLVDPHGPNLAEHLLAAMRWSTATLDA
jgi:EAL and modified HD-GYP domain-containing signal transduction protein